MGDTRHSIHTSLGSDNIESGMQAHSLNACVCRDPTLFFKIQSPYEFPEKGGRTHKWLYAQRGTSPRLVPMTIVSNHSITEEEFRGWRQQCDKDNRPQISLAEVEEVRQRLRKAET